MLKLRRDKNKKFKSPYSYIRIWAIIALLFAILEGLGNAQQNETETSIYASPWLYYTIIMCATIFILTVIANICLYRFIGFRYLKEIIALQIGDYGFNFIGPYFNAWLLPEIQFIYQFKIKHCIIQILTYSIIYFIINQLTLKYSKPIQNA